MAHGNADLVQRAHHVSRGIHIGHVRSAMVVDDDALPIIELDAQRQGQ